MSRKILPPSCMSYQLARVNVMDELELRDVLFGEGGTGRSYVVLCQDEKSTAPISSVFSDAYKDVGGTVGRGVHFRLLDCNYVLPSSGKSIAERFQLDLSIRPTIFISGTGMENPTQIPAKHLKTGKMLVKAIKSKLEPHAAKIETTQDLRTKCLNKPICGLLLKGSKKASPQLKEAMQKLMTEFPKIDFAAVDCTVFYVKNVEDILPEPKGDEPRFVVFQKISGSTDADAKDRLITSMAALDAGVAVSYGTLSNLMAGVVRKTIAPTKLSALPQIKTRTKKLLQEEKAKRERRVEQEKRQKEKESSTTGGSGSQANDGSREGRRAERERRRAEHNAKHNIKEKTPEEIAELERKRRERMAQESEKWNIAPDDAPPEGDLMDDEGYDDFYEEVEPSSPGADFEIDVDEVIDLD